MPSSSAISRKPAPRRPALRTHGAQLSSSRRAASPAEAAPLSPAQIESAGRGLQHRRSTSAARPRSRAAPSAERAGLRRARSPRYRGARSGAVIVRRPAHAARRSLRCSAICCESTIWHDFTHIDGFVASYLEDGLACPLLLQIADELRATFPGILGPHPLTQAWAFKGLEAAGGGRRPRRRCRGQREFLGDAGWGQPGAGSRRAAVSAARRRLPAGSSRDYDADQARIVNFWKNMPGTRSSCRTGRTGRCCSSRACSTIPTRPKFASVV